MSDSGATIYLCYGSVRGEAEVPGKVSKAPASGGWMKLATCSFAGASNYGTRYSQSVQGSADITPIQVSKLTDASSTGMFREAVLGTFDKKAVITFLRTGTVEPQEYMRVELEDCGIVDFAIDSGGDERATERFSIRYGSMTVISWSYDKQGTPVARAMATLKGMA